MGTKTTSRCSWFAELLSGVPERDTLRVYGRVCTALTSSDCFVCDGMRCPVHRSPVQFPVSGIFHAPDVGWGWHNAVSRSTQDVRT